MSDIGRVRKPGSSPFPTIRKSVDPLQPESGEIEFSEELKNFDETSMRTVQETEKAINSRIEDNDKEKKLKKRFEKREKKKQEQESEEDLQEEGSIVDIEV